ncbi:MAG: hypothetical protein H0U75_13160 [Legionella sp.]|nr:hypothetical protein [Legionella sp.]
MKAIIACLLFVCTLESQAACKCSCDPMDRRICAGSYDLDRPCGSICSSGQAPGFTPMITACPVRRVINELTGARELIVECSE